MDRWMDAWKIMLLIYHPYYEGSDVASLVEFCPVVYEEIACRLDGQTTDEQMEKCCSRTPFP